MIAEPIIKQDNIQTILLQEPPILLVDELLQHDDTSTVTSFTVKESGVFVSDGVFREPGLIENIAQTAASRLGYLAFLLKRDLNLGYIGAIKKLKILSLPPVSSKLITKIEIAKEVFNVTIANATIHVDDKLVVSCEMKIFIVK